MLDSRCGRTFLLMWSSLLLAGGCAPKSQGEKMLQSFADTRDVASTANRRVGRTMSYLYALQGADGNNISDAWRKYKDAVNELEVQDADTRFQAAGVKHAGDEHIKAWEKEMESIKDPQIKSTLQDRQKAVRTNFKLVQMYADDARMRFGPFLNGNKELVKALSIDLSPAAVAALGPSINKVMVDGASLNERLIALQQALDNIANGVSPLGMIE